MQRVLNVFLYDRFAGRYVQNESGLNEFIYDTGYVHHPDSIPLSRSLPLREGPFAHHRCRGFFAGILPEGEQRRIIAQNLRVSANNDFSLLDRIGGECAGAVTFLPDGQQPDTHAFVYQQISGEELLQIIAELSMRPLLAGRAGIRLSLAGAQDKLAVYISPDGYFLSIGNTPSSHILKPAIPQYADSVENEAFCMTLAATLGMHISQVEIRAEKGKRFLLVERYDRISTDDPLKPMLRLHQEDFCQALAVAPEKKYEEEGGVSIKDCFVLIRDVSASPLIDLQRLLDAIIFNFLIGNHDAHGKNFSLLYQGTGNGYQIRLAPLYDLICTAVYPDLSANMAMSIGGKFKSESITPHHFDRMAEEAGLSRPLVRERVRGVAAGILRILSTPGAIPVQAPAVVKVIEGNARKAVKVF